MKRLLIAGAVLAISGCGSGISLEPGLIGTNDCSTNPSSEACQSQTPDGGSVGGASGSNMPDAARDAVADLAFDSGPDAGTDKGQGGSGDDGPGDGGGNDTSPDLSADATDATPDLSVDVTPDLSVDSTPPACNVLLGGAPTSASASLPQDIAGTWQVCGDVSNLPADILWVLGNGGTIQLDGVNWWRLGPGQLSHGNQAAAGTYFRVLEGNGNVLQFVDANVNTGAGATLAVDFFTSLAVLELASCDGAGTCGDPVARLIPATQ